jgi:hypothetical protein
LQIRDDEVLAHGIQVLESIRGYLECDRCMLLFTMVFTQL